MKILLVTPAPPGSRKGNRVSALRWSRIFRKLGHRVTICEEFTDQRCDILIALHARRSAASVARFAQQRPDAPLVVVMTGTDLYHDINRSAAARRSLELADRLVLLQEHGINFLPPAVRKKARAIVQSARSPRGEIEPLKSVFEVAVVGHLRDVKDPLRTAMAARLLPKESKIRVVQIGGALSPSWQEKAQRETQRNPRYRWLGELPPWKARRLMQRSRLLVVSSKMEGAPNVASEALAAGVPMLSSKISGMIGMLGENYPGYFQVGDTQALADLLSQAERDKSFYTDLQKACQRLRPLVDPRREQSLWQQLLAELDG